MENFDEYFKKFLYILQFVENRSDNSIRSIKSDLKQLQHFLENVEPTKNFNEIDHYKIKRFLGWGRQESVGIRSLNRKLSTTRAFFKYLQKEEVVSKNPTELVDFSILPLDEPSFISKENIDKIRGAIEPSTLSGLRNRLMIELLYSTGITSQELLSLGERVFDLEERTLKVIQRKGSRQVFFSERVVYYYKEYTAMKKEKYGVKFKKDILFLNGLGTRLSDRSLRRIVARYAKKAGIEIEVTPYTFRHTFALHLIVKGMEIDHVRQLLGHTTLEHVKYYKELSNKSEIRRNIN